MEALPPLISLNHILFNHLFDYYDNVTYQRMYFPQTLHHYICFEQITNKITKVDT